MDIATVTREELQRRVMWGDPQIPGPNDPDWPSIVSISGEPDNYTDAELRKIVAFAQQVTVRHDRLFNNRRGANLYLLKKWPDGMWMRRRSTWYQGNLYSRTLDEALAALAPELFGRQEGETK